MQRAPAGEFYREENAGENLAVQTTGPLAVDSEHDSITSDESNKPGGERESKSEEEDSKKEESNNPSRDSVPSEHARLNKVNKEGVASGIRQLTLQDRVLVNTTPPKQQTEPMASNLAGPSRWTGTRTDSVMLKAAHPDPFYGGNLKAKIFLQQVDNKIADAAGASKRRQIRYMISPLGGPAAEWVATYMDNKWYTTFKRYGDLRKKFLKRFTDPNPSGTALARLLLLKQGRTRIQEYATKALTLAHQSQIGNQGAKILIFNGLLYKEQEYIMLANAQMTKVQLGKETVEKFLHRASMMLWRHEVRKGMYLAGRERHGMAPTKQATWGHGTDPMELDMMQTTDKKRESRKCFQCGKARHICRNCRSARGGNILASLEIGKQTRPGNGGSLGQGRLITLPAI